MENCVRGMTLAEAVRHQQQIVVSDYLRIVDAMHAGRYVSKSRPVELAAEFQRRQPLAIASDLASQAAQTPPPATGE